MTDYGNKDFMIASIRFRKGLVHFSHMHDSLDLKDHKFSVFTLTDNYMLRVSIGSCHERGTPNINTNTGILLSGMAATTQADAFDLAFAYCIDPDENSFKNDA